MLKYLNTPVKMEGVLQRKLDGTVNELPLKDGSILEYMVGKQWNIGFLNMQYL
ncbi:MAG: hypothetical protein K6G03_10340 [Lachnospiraceae bacterium]|nr:hypothetical protein [Lachnospiraceae bacterium]